MTKDHGQLTSPKNGSFLAVIFLVPIFQQPDGFVPGKKPAFRNQDSAESQQPLLSLVECPRLPLATDPQPPTTEGEQGTFLLQIMGLFSFLRTHLGWSFTPRSFLCPGHQRIAGGNAHGKPAMTYSRGWVWAR